MHADSCVGVAAWGEGVEEKSQSVTFREAPCGVYVRSQQAAIQDVMVLQQTVRTQVDCCGSVQPASA